MPTGADGSLQDRWSNLGTEIALPFQGAGGFSSE